MCGAMVAARQADNLGLKREVEIGDKGGGAWEISIRTVFSCGPFCKHDRIVAGLLWPFSVRFIQELRVLRPPAWWEQNKETQ